MKRAATIVALLSFFSVLGSAQEHPEWYSTGLLNGRYWTSLDERAKAFYLAGYRDGLVVGVGSTGLAEAGEIWERLRRGRFPIALIISDVVKGVDKFFSEAENLRFPIVDAVGLFARKAAGASQGEIDLQMAGLRRRFP
jgi:hypothetical protein